MASATSPSWRARATIVLRHCEPARSAGEAIQNRAGPRGTPPAHDLRHRPPGLLRRLRRLAMTVVGPPSWRARSNPETARRGRFIDRAPAYIDPASVPVAVRPRLSRARPREQIRHAGPQLP